VVDVWDGAAVPGTSVLISSVVIALGCQLRHPHGEKGMNSVVDGVVGHLGSSVWN
jgi:hypothetical protein